MKYRTFFEAKTALRNLNNSKGWMQLTPIQRREMRKLDKLRSLTRGQREEIARVVRSL